jgi:glycerol-3-phosphate dehydrogenase (NAD+)
MPRLAAVALVACVALADGFSLAADLSSIKVAIFGGGSFGTAMAAVLGRKGVEAVLIVRRDEVVSSINERHKNPYYQSDLLLPPSVRATRDAAEAFADADFIFHAVPVQASRGALQQAAPLIAPHTPVISLAKGIETSSLCLMSDLLPQCLGTERQYAFLSGPSFAAEIVSPQPPFVCV